MAEPPQKAYGLITKKKPQKTLAAAVPITAFAKASRLAAFASESSDDDDDSTNGKDVKQAAGKSKVSGAMTIANTKVNLSLGVLQQRQIRKAQDAAVAADPTIYQYDELFDDIQERRDTAKSEAAQKQQQGASADGTKPKPKYIERLLRTADARKKEYERRIERQVQKEREAEGAEFADKESFVTSSYRAKLEEMRAAEAAEQRDEYLESVGDVTKQRDLGGFYRHLYEQRMTSSSGNDQTTTDKDGEDDVLKRESVVAADMKKAGANNRERTYRKRKSDAEDEEETESTATVAKQRLTTEQHLNSNLDADSDFSIDSSSSESEGEAENKTTKLPAEDQDTNTVVKLPKHKHEEKLPTQTNVAESADIFAKPLDPIAAEPSVKLEEEIIKPAESSPQKPLVKVKVNIWLKRTVGDVLQAAIMRYQERKAARAEN